MQTRTVVIHCCCSSEFPPNWISGRCGGWCDPLQCSHQCMCSGQQLARGFPNFRSTQSLEPSSLLSRQFLQMNCFDPRVCSHLLLYCYLFIFILCSSWVLSSWVLLAIDPVAFLARAFLPDSIMLNSVISACEKAAEWQRALQLLETRLFLWVQFGFVMTIRGFVPDIYIYISYTYTCS